jgi:hypothetical protein
MVPDNTNNNWYARGNLFHVEPYAIYVPIHAIFYAPLLDLLRTIFSSYLGAYQDWMYDIYVEIHC